MTPEHDFLTVKEAAAILRVGVHLVYDMIRLGQIQAIKCGERGKVRIIRASLYGQQGERALKVV